MAPSLIDLIAGTLGVSPAEISDDSAMDTVRKWDSLRHVMLMTELEMRYDIELAENDMASATSVAKIRDLLARHGITA